jgi:SHS2 domain-containing protein
MGRGFSRIILEAPNSELLLVDWLAEILCLSDTHKRAYLNYQIIDFTPNCIKANVGSMRAQAKNDIKAVTYNELSITKKGSRWEVIVVFDI